MNDAQRNHPVVTQVPGCPFCGKTQLGTIRNEANRHVAVLCKSCGATGPRVTYDNVGVSDIEDVIVPWCRRVESDSMSQAVESYRVINRFHDSGLRNAWFSSIESGWRDAVLRTWDHILGTWDYASSLRWRQFMLSINIVNPEEYLTEFRFIETPRRAGIKVGLI